MKRDIEDKDEEQRKLAKLATDEEEIGDDEITQLIALSKTPSLKPPFTAITKLDLFQADLSSLPLSLPQHLPNLSILFCMKNKFETMPAVIGRCQKLQMVSFKSNNISTIEPDALQPQMRWLILTDNKIESLPPTIGRCSKLQKCMLSGNQLRSLPNEISGCVGLELIRLASNQLEEPPMELLKLPKLSWVALSDNPFLSVHAPADETTLKVFDEVRLDDPAQALAELGKGASGITRKYKLDNDDVAVKEYYSNITSDGNPQEERKVSMVGSSLGCKSLVKVLGKTLGGNLIMELLSDYKVFANPPSLESCSRDVYNDDDSMTIDQAVSMAGQMIYTLMKLHEKGINHGDFYGHNILVSTKLKNRVWLTDFGAAFFYDTASDYGKLIEQTERRALGHLINEIANLVKVDDEADSVLKKDLSKFAEGCDAIPFNKLHSNFTDAFSLKQIRE